MTDPNWHMVPPLMTLPPSLKGYTQVKSVIYVNNQLPSHSFAAIKTDSPMIAEITIALPLPHLPLHLLSAYLPPTQPQTMSCLTPILSHLRPSPVLLGMDLSLHHTLWNPPAYPHTHREAEDLMSLMNNAGLLLRSERGVPTYISNQTRNRQNTVDLQWLLPDCYDWATVC